MDYNTNFHCGIIIKRYIFKEVKMISLIDTHSHIDMIEGISTEEVLKNAADNLVTKIIVPCAYPKDIDKIYNLVQKYESLYGMLGVHPSEARDWNDDLFDKITKLAMSDKIIAIGEIGLDYYWDKTFNEIQKEVFIKQIRLANSLGLPISIHDREAHKDTFDIVKEYNKGSQIVMHCFSGSTEFARECIKQGWYLAFGGVVTFKNAIKAKEAVKNIPMDRLLLETDAPYLTPVPFRGTENQPAYVKFVAEEIAKIRGVTFEEIAEVSTSNAKRVFGI